MGEEARRWPQARAVLIVLHVVAITALALPAPAGGLDRRTWKDPTVQAELNGWRQILGSLGWEMDQATFEDRLFEVSAQIMKARDAALAPMKPYHLYFGTWQSWRMFVAPHTNPAKLVVEVGSPGAWEVVFEERSEEHTWKRYVFEQDRMRSAIFRYSWPNFKAGYRELCEWIAKQAAQDFPEAERVRVRYYKMATRSAEEVLAGAEVEGRWVQTWERELAALREEAP